MDFLIRSVGYGLWFSRGAILSGFPAWMNKFCVCRKLGVVMIKKRIADNIVVGAEYDGIVRNIVDFGVFVQIAPGTDGLIHRSVIAREKQPRLSELLNVGGTLKVVVKSCDRQTGRIGLVAPELQ